MNNLLRKSANAAFVFLFLSYYGIAQNQLITDLIDPSQMNQELLYGSGGKNLTGDPYLFDEFLPGTVYLKTGGEIKVSKINLHTYHNLFIIEEDGSRSSLSTQQVAAVSVNEGALNRSFLSVGSGKNTIYYENLFVGDKSNLLKKYAGKIVQAQQTDGYTSSNLTKDRIEKVSSFCIYLNRDKVIELYGGKSAMADQASAGVGQDLKPYIKKNKLKINKEEDLIVLINHIDEKIL